MARNQPTFGGVHRPVARDGRAHSADQAARRASFDHEPAPSGCATATLTTLALTIAALIGVLT